MFGNKVQCLVYKILREYLLHSNVYFTKDTNSY